MQPVGEGTPVTGSRASILPSCSSTPGTGQLPAGSGALMDLMELVEDGVTLTQYRHTASGSDKGNTLTHCQTVNMGEIICLS